MFSSVVGYLHCLHTILAFFKTYRQNLGEFTENGTKTSTWILFNISEVGLNTPIKIGMSKLLENNIIKLKLFLIPIESANSIG